MVDKDTRSQEPENVKEPYAGLVLEKLRLYKKKAKTGYKKIWCAFRLYPEIMRWLTQYGPNMSFVVNLALEEFALNHKDELLGEDLHYEKI